MIAALGDAQGEQGVPALGSVLAVPQRSGWPSRGLLNIPDPMEAAEFLGLLVSGR